MGADGRVEHRPATPGAENFKITGPNRERDSRQEKAEDQLSADVSHLILSFTFDIFSSPLSGKRLKLSTGNVAQRLIHDAKKKLAKRRCSAGRARTRRWA
jgi:hypothetical protein